MGGAQRGEWVAPIREIGWRRKREDAWGRAERVDSAQQKHSKTNTNTNG